MPRSCLKKSFSSHDDGPDELKLVAFDTVVIYECARTALLDDQGRPQVSDQDEGIFWATAQGSPQRVEMYSISEYEWHCGLNDCSPNGFYVSPDRRLQALMEQGGTDQKILFDLCYSEAPRKSKPKTFFFSKLLMGGKKQDTFSNLAVSPSRIGRPKVGRGKSKASRKIMTTAAA